MDCSPPSHQGLLDAPSQTPLDHRLSQLFLAAVVACNGDDLTQPTTGTLMVTTLTGGSGLDSDGYTVQVDNGPLQPIAATGTVQNSLVSSGSYTVQLAGMAPNCAVSGDNPRSVTVTAGQTTTVSFEVTCNTTTPVGALEITTVTTGESPDADGYTLQVDDGTGQPIAANGTFQLSDLASGNHTLRLGGIAGNCSLDGQNPRTVTVPADATLPVASDPWQDGPVCLLKSVRVRGTPPVRWSYETRLWGKGRHRRN